MAILSSSYVVTRYMQVQCVYRYKVTQLDMLVAISVRQ